MFVKGEVIYVKYSFLYDDCIYTYEINETNKEEVLEKIKEYAILDTVEKKSCGSSGVIKRILLNEIKANCDEILEYDSKESGGNGRYGGPLDVHIVAIVKKYPILYHIIKDNQSLPELLDYLKGNLPIRKAYRSDSVFQLVRSINQIKTGSSNEDKFNYDENIGLDDKIQIIQNYISGLQFHLVKTQTLEEIRKDIDWLKSTEMFDYNSQQAFIMKQSQQLEEAQKNTEVFQELCQLSDLNFNDIVEDVKKFTKTK